MTSSESCFRRLSRNSGVAMAAPKRVGDRFTIAFRLLTALTTSGAATMMPVRTPGKPTLERLKQRIDVFVPIQRHVAVNDVGERHSVGVVDNQRNAVFLHQSVQLRHFAVGQHVAGRVGRTRTANRADFACFEFGQAFQRVKVHAVFKKPASP